MPVYARQAITVLVEAAQRWPHLAPHLFPLLRAYPRLALAAGGAALTMLADTPGIDPAVLEAVEPPIRPMRANQSLPPPAPPIAAMPPPIAAIPQLAGDAALFRRWVGDPVPLERVLDALTRFASADRPALAASAYESHAVKSRVRHRVHRCNRHP